MQNIAQDQHRCQEIFLLFYLSPPSIQAFIPSNGRLVKVPGFTWQYNPLDLFDLSQDPPLLNYPAFITRWPFLKDATVDLIATKYPDTDSRPGNPHSFANLMVCFVLAAGLTPSIDSDRSQDPDPQPESLPEEKRPLLQIVKKPTSSQPLPVPEKKLLHLPPLDWHSPPDDVLDKIHARNPPPSVLVIYAALFRFSWYGSSKYLFVWHEKEHRNSRFVHEGIKALAKITGYEEKQVKRALEWLDLHNFIYLIHQGWKGEGNSIYELPKDMTTVNVFIHKKIVKIIRKKRG